MTKQTKTNGTYGDNYRSLNRSGHEVSIQDEYMSYCYDLADGDTLDAILDAFSDGYDLGESDSVTLEAREYVDGEIVSTSSLTLER